MDRSQEKVPALQKAAGNSNFKHNSLLTQHLPSTGCIAKANAVRCAHDSCRAYMAIQQLNDTASTRKQHVTLSADA
jgi:hypothetical protein